MEGDFAMKTSRRALLSVASQAAIGFAATPPEGSAASILSSGVSPARKLKIVVTGGHPGDPEYGCGGTVAALTQQGHEVVLLYLNDGAWQETSAAVRSAEATQACRLLGATPAYVGQRNGSAVVDNDHYAAFGRNLQAMAPDAVFTHWLLDNHRDHRAIAMLAFDAWNQSQKKFALYYYEVSDGEDTVQFAPSRYVDVSKTEPRKRAACYAHASQTPIRYYELQDTVARFRGLESGYARAEAFLLQLGSPFDIFPGAVVAV